jgi:outer membrane protein assembly factor BamB
VFWKKCRKFGYFATKISYMAHFFSRRPVVILSVAAVLLLMAVLYFIRSANPGPWHAIPSSIPLVMEFNSLKQEEQLRTQQGGDGWKGLLQAEIFEKGRQDIGLLESLFGTQAGFVWALQKGKLYAAYSFNDADSLHGLFVTEPGATFNLEKSLAQNTRTQKYFPATFHDHTLYTVWFSREDRMVICQLDNLLLFSRFSYLVEEAIAQTEDRSSWWANRKYVNELKPDAPFRLFLQPEALAQAMSGKVNPELEHLPDMFSQNTEWLGFAWDGLNVSMMAETKGFLKQLAALGTAPPGNLLAVTPDHTALLAWVGFDKKNVFTRAMDDPSAGDFQTFIAPWLGNGVAFVLTEPRSPGFREDELLFFQVADSTLALQRLREYGQRQGALRHETYQTFDILEFLSPSLLAPFIHRKENFRNPVCALLGDYIVFAPNRSALEVCIDKFIVNQTLASNPDCIQMWSQLPQEENNGLVIMNGQYFSLLSQNFLSDFTYKNNTELLGKISETGFSGVVIRTAESGKLIFQVATQKTTTPVTQTGILWKTPLAGPIHSAPNLVSTGSGDYIFVQDDNNQLYCLDAGGVVLWRRQMEGTLLSEVQAVGNPGQTTPNFAFNTAAHIWLLDEKGQDIGRFPLELRSPATNGMIAIDFDNTLKFNYFVACANGNLYGFDHTGSALPGWNPNNGAGKIIHPLRHFQHEGLDFLVALNSAPQLKVFGRNGQTRFPPVSLNGHFVSPPQLDDNSKNPRIACFNTEGKVFVCNTAGAVSSVQMGKGNQRALGILVPLGGDERADLAVLQGNSLRANTYKSNGLQNAFSVQLPVPQDTLFEVAGQRIGLVYREKNQIFLVDGMGKIHPDFPLAGTSPFVLRPVRPGSKESLLIVGNNNQLFAYTIR